MENFVVNRLGLSTLFHRFFLQLLTEKKLLSSDYGRPTLAILLLQDLAVVLLLAFVSLLAEPDLTMAEDVLLAVVEAISILALIIVAARCILNPLLNILVRFG